jgi:hypothetical protein
MIGYLAGIPTVYLLEVYAKPAKSNPRDITKRWQVQTALYPTMLASPFLPISLF